MTSTVDRLNSALTGRYRIERELGAGGMATVYLAFDEKHDRQVAIKVLHPDLGAALGADRFLAEIKTTAKLQHPHILPLLDSGSADGLLFYVMPYVTGETLRARLERERQLPLDDAILVAREVADALGAAHAVGVVHRDIKPENILLRGGHAVVADFGIALAVQSASGARMTQTGLSLGTPQYMSPEQAMGEKVIDHRSDLYSLGAVTYEMLVGEAPFTGPTVQAIVARVMTEEPRSVAAQRKAVPDSVDAAVRRALEKLPADRFASAAEFVAALDGAVPIPRRAQASSRITSHRWNPLTVALAVIATGLAALQLRSLLRNGPSSASDAPVVRFALAGESSLAVESGATRPFAISPDGRSIVFRASSDSFPAHLWVRALGESRVRRLEGTANGINPAISPDGQTVAFTVENRELRTVPIAGGPVRNVATLEFVSAALTWESNDTILLESLSPSDGLHRVSANGGEPERILPLDSARSENRQRRPMMLRDAGVIVYGSSMTDREFVELVLYRPADRKRVELGLPGIGGLAYVDGYLIYSGALGELQAVKLDARAMRVEGSPIQLVPRVAFSATGTAVAVSEGGTLVYRTEAASTDARIDLMDTSGRGKSVPGTFAVHGTPRFSADGKRLVLVLGTGGVQGRRRGVVPGDIWLVDVASGEPTRVTTNVGAIAPTWFPDRRRILYGAGEGGRPRLWTVGVDGSEAPAAVLDLDGVPLSADVMPDAKSVVVSVLATGSTSLLRAWLDGSKRIDTLVKTDASGIRPSDPRVSPDGRWVAFQERSTGDVYVRSLSGPGQLQVSAKPTEGNPVVWSPDSRHLYYRTAEGLQAIDLQMTPSLGVSKRRLIGRFPAVTDYDLSPDGRTFAVVAPILSASDVIVAVNWLAEARRAWSTAGK